MEELVAWASDPLLIQPVWFKCWLKGMSEREAAQSESHSFWAGFGEEYSQLLQREVSQQYALFSSLKPLLDFPHQLQDQTTFHLSPQIYYDFDPIFFREIIGKKLASSLRKSIETIAQQSNLREESCLRQYENLRRVSKIVNRSSQGTITDMIRAKYLLSPELSSKYSNVIFACQNQISLSKRSLHSLSFADVNFMLSNLVNYWGQMWSVDFDLGFADEARALFIDSKACEELRNGTIEQLAAKGVVSSFFSERNLAQMIKTMLSICANLNQPREVRDIFLDVSDKLADPLLQQKIKREDVSLLFESLSDSLSGSTTLAFSSGVGGGSSNSINSNNVNSSSSGGGGGGQNTSSGNFGGRIKNAQTWLRCVKGIRGLVLVMHSPGFYTSSH